MEIGERLRLSESSEWLACFREERLFDFTRYRSLDLI